MSRLGFVPPRDGRFYLLRAHRQPLPSNDAAYFIEAYTREGDIVVDPFVGSDAVVRAAVERGRRVIASDSNPLVAWATRVQATVPGGRDVNAALVRLGETRKEGESLKAVLEKPYTSQCAGCGDPVVVDYFVHRREGDKKYLAAKVFTCANCGTRRDDATEVDRQRAADAGPRGLTYHLLFQRLLADEAAHSGTIKRLLELYTPRNLALLAALTQKLDAEFRDDPGRNLLAAMLLHALDVGSMLYPEVDGLPARDVPNEFVEVNIWRALEEAARGLGEHAPPLRLAQSIETVLTSAAPGAFVGQGGARALAENALASPAPDGQAANVAALVLASPARLDPLFWELSFLWTRWLLGKTAAAALEPLLDERRQKWGWYGEALTNALADTARLVRDDARLVVAFPAASHAMIEALMLAAAPAFALEEFAFRPHRGMMRSTEFGAVRGDYQVVWRRAPAAVAPVAAHQLASRVRERSLAAAMAILEARGEPLLYTWVHHAALDKLARSGLLAEVAGARYRSGDNAYQFLRHRMEEGLKEGYIHNLDHAEEKGRVLWMARQEEKETRPLADRVEGFVREQLAAAGRINAGDLEEAVLAEFPGLLTPEPELVELCARAYASREGDEWVWRAADERAELESARERTRALGERLGYRVVDEARSKDGKMIWELEKVIPGSASGTVREERVHEEAFELLFASRADLGALARQTARPRHGLIVIPERQVDLTRERLRRDPRRARALERAGWDFLRIPCVDLLLRETETTPPEFQLAWGLDPPLELGEEQLKLF